MKLDVMGITRKTDLNPFQVMTMNPLAAMPLRQLKRAITLREQIDTLTQELNQLMGVQTFITARGNDENGHGARGRGIPHKSQGLSPAGRARIAAAQRLRWMRYKVARGVKPERATKSQRLSAEGRARVSAAVKARWERYRATKARNGHGR